MNFPYLKVKLECCGFSIFKFLCFCCVCFYEYVKDWARSLHSFVFIWKECKARYWLNKFLIPDSIPVKTTICSFKVWNACCMWLLHMLFNIFFRTTISVFLETLWSDLNKNWSLIFCYNGTSYEWLTIYKRFCLNFDWI